MIATQQKKRQSPVLDLKGGRLYTGHVVSS